MLRSPDYAPLRPVRRCTSPSYTSKPRKLVHGCTQLVSKQECTLTCPPDPKSQCWRCSRSSYTMATRRWDLHHTGWWFGKEHCGTPGGATTQPYMWPRASPCRQCTNVLNGSMAHWSQSSSRWPCIGESIWLSYLCTVGDDGHIHTSFVLARSRVAPEETRHALNSVQRSLAPSLLSLSRPRSTWAHVWPSTKPSRR